MKKIKKITSAVLAAALAVSTLALNVSAAEDEHKAVVSIEAFSIGNGYVIEPTEVTFTQGETVAAVVDRLFKEKNVSYESTGTVEENFYLKSVTFENSNKIPSYITNAVVAHDDETGEDILFGEYIEDGSPDTLGMNDYCSYLAGWMFTVNAPTAEAMSLTMSQTTVNDGDVIRVQFSLDCGADIGTANLSGMPQWGYHSDFYPVADKTQLTKAIAQSQAAAPSPTYNAVSKMKTTAANLPATQQEVDSSLSDYNAITQLNPLSGDVDLDGDIKLKDAIITQKNILQMTELSSVASLVADCNSDGSVNLIDAISIQKSSVGIA